MMLSMKTSKECPKMTFEEFKQEVLHVVRSRNHMGLIDDWEKHIIYKDFSFYNLSGTTYCGNVYYGTIYYADKTFKNELTIRIYTFSYLEISGTASIDCTECSLFKEEITSICKLSQCFDANKSRFFDCTLDAYHNAGMEVK